MGNCVSYTQNNCSVLKHGNDILLTHVYHTPDEIGRPSVCQHVAIYRSENLLY